jgi:hypothetical protein
MLTIRPREDSLSTRPVLFGKALTCQRFSRSHCVVLSKSGDESPHSINFGKALTCQRFNARKFLYLRPRLHFQDVP